MIINLKNFNPGIHILFTISPVRHLREGFMENNRSKALLITGVHRAIEKFENTFYFPAYELVIDDLRDYRFYAEDMVHPNYAATNYVWDKFLPCCINQNSRLLVTEIQELNAARSHKPFNPGSEAHQQFKMKYLQKALHMQQNNPGLNLSDEIKHFS
jgi:hypothetical protein